jgi:hypothetical protein
MLVPNAVPPFRILLIQGMWFFGSEVLNKHCVLSFLGNILGYGYGSLTFLLMSHCPRNILDKATWSLAGRFSLGFVVFPTM